MLVLRAAGCHEPEKATVTATATGVVSGKRQSIPLKLTKLSEPGTYALAQQWPKEGKWVIEMSAKDGNRMTFTMASAGPDGIDRLHAKQSLEKPFSKSEVESMLD